MNIIYPPGNKTIINVPGGGSGSSGVQAKIKAPFIPINQPITDGQTIQQAFESTQGQINAIVGTMEILDVVSFTVNTPSQIFTLPYQVSSPIKSKLNINTLTYNLSMGSYWFLDSQTVQIEFPILQTGDSVHFEYFYLLI